MRVTSGAMTFGQMTKNACLEGSVVSTDDRTCKRSSSNPAGGDTLKNNMLYIKGMKGICY